jgi:hypothetical protein
MLQAQAPQRASWTLQVSKPPAPVQWMSRLAILLVVIAAIAAAYLLLHTR